MYLAICRICKDVRVAGIMSRANISEYIQKTYSNFYFLETNYSLLSSRGNNIISEKLKQMSPAIRDYITEKNSWKANSKNIFSSGTIIL